MVKKMLPFWELKEGMYVSIDTKVANPLKGNDGDDDEPKHFKMMGRVYGIIESVGLDKAIIRLASGGKLVVFNTGVLATKDGRTFPYDVEVATEAQFVSEQV